MPDGNINDVSIVKISDVMKRMQEAVNFADNANLEATRQAAAGQFPRWCFVRKRGNAGLLNRRLDETRLFMREYPLENGTEMCL